MKVVLLTTLRAQRPSWLLEVKEQLGLADRPDVEVSIVSAHRPNWPLPVTQHLLAAPALSISGAAKVLRVASADTGMTTEGPDGDGVATRVPEGTPESETESLTEAMTGSLTEDPNVPLGGDPGGTLERDSEGTVGASTATEKVSLPASSVLHLPVYHPRRVVKAASWRANKVRLTVKRHPGLARVRNSTKLRKARVMIAPGGISGVFALTCVWAANIGALVGSADVVVALDANSHRAAWLLARRHPRPAVIVGTAAGKRVIEELEASSPR